MRRAAFASVIVFALLAPSRASGTDDPAIAVVVGKASEISELDADAIRDLFLRRRTLLAGGARIVPVNLPVGDSARERFSIVVLNRRPAELATYWDRLYFEGIRPPIVLPSAQALRRYLEVDSHAIGYLLPEDVGDGLRVIGTFPRGEAGRERGRQEVAR